MRRGATRQAVAWGSAVLLLAGGAGGPVPTAAAGLSRWVRAQGRLQLSSWTDWRSGAGDWRSGTRLIPELSLRGSRAGGLAMDVEAAADLSAWTEVDGLAWPGADRRWTDADAYRLWLRLAGDRFEARAGLQQINFGTATLLRPLMWFDRLDPRDPLGLTQGVWAGLVRYYLLDNGNAWLWAVRSDRDGRNWGVLPSESGAWETGGRVQHPLGPGELGITLHRRPTAAAGLPGALGRAAETRLGVDGRWDAVIGAWFEGVVIRPDSDLVPCRYAGLLTLGADYTFAVGSGVHALGEHLVSARGDRFPGRHERRQVSAAALDYGPSVVDRLFIVAYRDWESPATLAHARWGRLYDRWSLYLSGFASTADGLELPAGAAAGNGRRGVQLLAVLTEGGSLW